MGGWKGWENFEPPPGTKDPFRRDTLFEEPPAPAPAPPPSSKPKTKERLDRGRRRGAKWVWITADRLQVPWEKGKKVPGAKLFRSTKEARYYVWLLSEKDSGRVRNLETQVGFACQCRNPAGLMVTIANYNADFVFESLESDGSWRPRVVDVKGNREDVYILKKKWVEAQHGITIEEA